jgi:hypothetical protein
LNTNSTVPLENCDVVFLKCLWKALLLLEAEWENPWFLERIQINTI